ncbi:MAG: ATP-binding cassette domain-containing protein [Allosphingosinicella sp.]
MIGPPRSFEAAVVVDVPEYPRIAAPTRSHVVLTGPSGSGKTAFCLLLAGVSDDSGREAKLQIFGDALAVLSDEERAHKIAFVPSDPFLAFTGLKSSLLGELEMIGRLVETAHGSGDRLLSRIADRLDLSGHLNRDPFTLSGGEAVRAALAMALMKRPLLLVLDQMQEQLDPSYIPHISAALAELLPSSSVVVETRSRTTAESRAASAAATPTPGPCDWHLDIRPLDAVGATPLDASCSLAQRGARGQEAQPPSAEALWVEGLAHSYPASGFRLGPINLRIGPGERIGLVGPNGSGKSTLLKCLALLERPTFDRLEISGRNGSTATPPPERQAHHWAAQALYCFQRPEDQLYLATVGDEIAETCRRLGVADTLGMALGIARRLGLEPYLGRSPYDIPRSFRRLVPVSAALAVGPPLLLLDEPTVGLDDRQVATLAGLLVETRHSGATIFISHDEAFTAVAATRVIDIRSLSPHQGHLSNPA